ncbi:MAG: hypothetical protein FWH24_02880 [Oscillospiraceae bacterium]|nr:hypothetical protein [Oscillospiraceae bacterium]
MKKFLPLILLGAFSFILFLSSCQIDNTGNKTEEPPADDDADLKNNGGNYADLDPAVADEPDIPEYESFIAGGEIGETVYIWNPSGRSADDILLVQAIQGITSRTKARVYMQVSEPYMLWLEIMQAEYGFDTVTVSDAWELAGIFKDYFDGYVTYGRTGTETMNYAATLAGVLDALPVSGRHENRAADMGLDKLDDAEAYDNISEIIEKHGGILNKKMFLNQRADNNALRDYGIKNSCIIAYPNSLTPVFDFSDANAILLGWHNDEVSGVKAASEKQVVTIASDHAFNLSFLSAVPLLEYKQQEPFDADLKAEDGKHYIAFAYSDGDNIQWLVQNKSLDINRFAHDKSAEIPFGWSVAPTIADFAPAVIQYMNKQAAPTDSFVAGVSGFGYIHPSEYLKANKLEELREFTKLTAGYMQRLGMKYTEILDEHALNPDIRMLDAFTGHEQIQGILYKCGDRYVGGRGFLRWSNGKPVVAFRETLWSGAADAERDIYRMAYRISQYDKNPKSIDGYTLINVHAWSHDYSSVEKLVTWLCENDENVAVVTPDTFFGLISENVQKEDAAPNKNWNDRWSYPDGLY